MHFFNCFNPVKRAATIRRSESHSNKVLLHSSYGWFGSVGQFRVHGFLVLFINILSSIDKKDTNVQIVQ